ncbi:unnamed protein product [Cunninghamella blakesleeana]
MSDSSDPLLEEYKELINDRQLLMYKLERENIKKFTKVRYLNMGPPSYNQKFFTQFLNP